VICAAGITLARLLDSWADAPGGDDDADALALEDHVFCCAGCTARLGWIAALADAVPAALERKGGQRWGLTRELVAHLERRGVRLRHYRFGANREVACTVAFDDDLVVSWIPVTTADDERVEAELTAPDGTVVARFDDLPVDRRHGEIITAEAAETLWPLPDLVLRLRLTAVGPAHRRDLGELVYHHTAMRRDR